MSEKKTSTAVNRILLAEKAYQAAIADESKTATKDLANALNGVVSLYESMESVKIGETKTLADGVWKEPIIEDMLKALGLVVKPKKEASASTGERVDAELLEKTILEICKTKSTAAEIMAHSSMVALYAAKGKVPQQSIKLKKLVEEKKLVKTGTLKSAAYQTK